VTEDVKRSAWPAYPDWAVTRWLRFEYRLRLIICGLALAALILDPAWWR
jgi:hypothetical protein